MDRDELTELLDDLQHDVGKHMVLPVAVLPADSSAAVIQLAVLRSLDKVSIWRQFVARHGGDRYPTSASSDGTLIGQHAGIVTITSAVDTACAWADRSGAELQIAAVVADMQAVAAAIRAARSGVADGQ
ncbi:MAG: hypothetical protein EXR77_04300 [Myxococcales bacterium]|nr:hypothetical protein [Myxococcales bacterium]